MRALLIAAAIAVSACVTQPRAPSSAAESIEAVEIAAQETIRSIDALTCARADWVAPTRSCREPGRPLAPERGLEFLGRVDEVRGALRMAVRLRAGEVVECLGAPRNQVACIGAARAALIALEDRLPRRAQ